MNRREVIAGLGALLSWSGRAQTPARMQKIAYYSTAGKASGFLASSGSLPTRTFLRELERLGYTEGGNLVIARFSAEGDASRYEPLAREIVAEAPDVIAGTGLVTQLKAATSTIPIVAVMADPIASGYAASLARPGGNITGVSIDAGVDVYGKYLELLRAIKPSLSRVGYLSLTKAQLDGPSSGAFHNVADSLRIEVVAPTLDAGGASFEEWLRTAVAEMVERGAEAIIVPSTVETYLNSRTIAALTLQHRCPAIFTFSHSIAEGGLIAYSYKIEELYRELARMTDRILKGASAAEQPIYQTTNFELAINLKTAKALGLTIPESLLARADEVIE